MNSGHQDSTEGSTKEIQVTKMAKEFITPKELYKDSFRLGSKILKSRYKPDILIAIWRGGTPIGCCVEEFLRINGIKTDHYPIKTSAYDHDELKRDIRVEMLEIVAKKVNKNTKILIVDDVYDTGRSIGEVLRTLKELKGIDMPENIKVATLHYKPEKNETTKIPDYFIHIKEKDTWLVYPHELEDLSIQELLSHRLELD